MNNSPHSSFRCQGIFADSDNQVMVSFWASAAITFICIIVGYLRGTLPGVPQNGADSLIKGLIRHPSTFHEILISSGPIPKNVHHKMPRAESGSRIEEAFESFLLSFSDQQLVTGLAMLVSMFSKGDITIYSFQVATAVAWFSSTIHLATLIVLRRHSLTVLVVWFSASDC